MEQADIDDDHCTGRGQPDGFLTAGFLWLLQRSKQLRPCATEVKPHEATRLGIIQLDESGRIIDFEEKPEKPKSNIAAYAVYIYKKETLKLLDEYLKAGNNPDAPGNFSAWLFKREPVYGYLFNGTCYDIGTHEAYREVQELYKDK